MISGEALPLVSCVRVVRDIGIMRKMPCFAFTCQALPPHNQMYLYAVAGQIVMKRYSQGWIWYIAGEQKMQKWQMAVSTAARPLPMGCAALLVSAFVAGCIQLQWFSEHSGFVEYLHSVPPGPPDAQQQQLRVQLRFLPREDALYRFVGRLSNSRLLPGNSVPPGAEYSTLPQLKPLQPGMVYTWRRPGQDEEYQRLFPFHTPAKRSADPYASQTQCWPNTWPSAWA